MEAKVDTLTPRPLAPAGAGSEAMPPTLMPSRSSAIKAGVGLRSHHTLRASQPRRHPSQPFKRAIWPVFEPPTMAPTDPSISTFPPGTPRHRCCGTRCSRNRATPMQKMAQGRATMQASGTALRPSTQRHASEAMQRMWVSRAALSSCPTAHCSPWQAFYEPNAERANFKVLTGANVSRIELESSGGLQRATGVRFVVDGKEHVVKVNKEVVVSAGTFKSPQVVSAWQRSLPMTFWVAAFLTLLLPSSSLSLSCRALATPMFSKRPAWRSRWRTVAWERTCRCDGDRLVQVRPWGADQSCLSARRNTCSSVPYLRWTPKRQ